MSDQPPAESTQILVSEVGALLTGARRQAQRQVNTLLVVTNFEIGRRIVTHEQQGAQRAAYGKEVIKQLSTSLTVEFGRGFSVRNLELMRRFFLKYQSRIGNSQTASAFSEDAKSAREHTAVSIIPPAMLPLSWSKYVFLMGISDPKERRFYELETIEQDWSLRELKRQFSTSLYERLALSRDEAGVRALAEQGQQITHPADLFKDPYVLDFLGLDEESQYSESDLESGIISKLEHFLLELGKGFLFEARQKRFTFDTDHFYYTAAEVLTG
jgi:predicted nuclease of restriction endonuclease-like (RecB) superfamily